MRRSGANISLILPGIALVAVFAAADARGTVVFSEGELSQPADISVAGPSQEILDSDPSCLEYVFQEEDGAPLRTDLGQVVGDWLTGPVGAAALPSTPADEEQQQPEKNERQQRLVKADLDTSGDMSPSPSSSVSSGGGSGGGSALISELVTPPQAAFQASLPPEARTILPTGPAWEWFRPPKNAESM